MEETCLVLGRIEGTLTQVLTNQKEHGDTLRDMDSRLRTVETKAAMNGAVGGGVMGLGMAVIIELIKARLGASVG